MAELQSSRRAPFCADEKVTTNQNQSPATSFDPAELDALRAASIMAGQHPQLAQALAKLLGIGADLAAVTPAPVSPMRLALQGAALAPFEGSFDWAPEIPSDAFEGGLGRVLAGDMADPKYLRESGLLAQVEASNLYGRLLVCAVDALAEGDVDGAHMWMRHDAAVLFAAGWCICSDILFAKYCSFRERDREEERTRKHGSVDELVDLLARKILLGSVDDQALTSGGYWTQAHVDEARRRVRAKCFPEDYNSEGNLRSEGGAR